MRVEGGGSWNLTSNIAFLKIKKRYIVKTKYSEKIAKVSIFGLSESAEPDHDDKHVD